MEFRESWLSLGCAILCAAWTSGSWAQSGAPFSSPTFVDTSPVPGAGLVAAQANGEGSADMFTPTVLFPMPGIGVFHTSLFSESGTIYDFFPGPSGHNPLAGTQTMAKLRHRAWPGSGGWLDHMVAFSSDGKLSLHFNGSSSQRRKTGTAYASGIVIDDYASRFPKSSPFEVHFTALLEAEDLDQDGFSEIVFGAQLSDIWMGTASSLPVLLYPSKPDGTFGAPISASTQYPAISGKLVDLDGDRTPETIVLLTDYAVPSAYGSYIEIFKIQKNGLQWSLVPQGSPRLLPVAIRATQLDVSDLNQDGIPDFVLAGFVSAAPGACGIYWIPSTDRQLNFGQPQQLIPGQPMAAPHEVAGVVIGKFDTDPHADVAVLMAGGAMSNSPNGNLVFFKGGASGPPNWLTGISVDLGARVGFKNWGFHSMWQVPLLSEYGQLRTVDVSPYGFEELMIGGLYTLNTGTSRYVSAILTNSSVDPNPLHRSEAVRIGRASPGPGGFFPRMGIDQGPVLDQPNFTLTLTDAPGDGAQAMVYFSPIRFPVSLLGEFNLEFPFIPGKHSRIENTSGAGPGGGAVRVGVPIPNDPSLLGQKVYFQWLVSGQDGNRTIPMSHSDALEVTLGRRRP